MIDSLDKLDLPRNESLLDRLVEKHLQGKHDQRTHGGGGGMGAPRDTAHAKQKQAWELHEQGKTWEEVAKEAGYANGGAARLAGKAHEKRVKAKGEGAEVPKPTEVVTPKPKTDKEGAKAIKDAQAVIDKATGGRPVADVLADEAKGKYRGTTPPTAKELEVTEAVIKSGQILRGEVDRRTAVLGKEVVDKSNSELVVLRKEKETAVKRQEEFDAQRKVISAQIHQEVRQSPELDEALDEQLIRKTQFSQVEAFSSAFEDDRGGAIEDMRGYIDQYAGGVPYTERDTWAKERAKARFPNDKKAQKEYVEMLDGSTWALRQAEVKVTARDAKVKKLNAEEMVLSSKASDATSEKWRLEKEISSRELLVRNGGVTPEQNAEIVRSVLIDSGRTMTTKPFQSIAGTQSAIDELRAELPKIPDELWNNQRFTSLNVEAKTRGRGHWSPSKQQIKTDGTKGGGRRASTLLHESMHAVEDMNPSITQMQFVMSHRRAKGAKPQQLSKLGTGKGYRADEVAIEDAWSNPYSGKIYSGGTRGSNWEIMTMGIESLYRRESYPYDRADEDHLNFTMGVLAYA